MPLGQLKEIELIMLKILKRRKGVYAFVALALLALALFSYFSNPTQHAIISLAKTTYKSLKVWRAGGEEAYLKNIIDKQLPVTERVIPPPTVIETSRLPIQVQYAALPKDFPVGAGAITKFNDSLIVMSRLGDFYLYRSESFKKLDWAKLPNNVDKYIVSSRGSMNSSALRATSISYDESGHKIYVVYNQYVSSGFNRLVVSSLEIDPVTLGHIGSWDTLFESDLVDADYGSENSGGRLAVRDGNIYFSVGYSEQSTLINDRVVPAGQNPASSLGKIFRINIKTREVELFSMGHRVVQGLTFTKSGDLLATEHGPQGGDEINLVQQGDNYGWPFRTYGTNYGSYNYTPRFEEPSNFVSADPMYAFVPSMAISPILLIQGFHSAWNDDILVGSLKAQSLFRLVIKSSRVVLSEPIWFGHRIRDIALYPENQIVLLTDDSLLAFLSVDKTLLGANKKNAGYNFEPKLARCLGCHHFETSTSASVAPSLRGVFNRRVGGDNFDKYSDGMKNATGIWDKNLLSAFLANPASVIPGTSMPNPGLSPEEVTDIVKIISK